MKGADGIEWDMEILIALYVESNAEKSIVKFGHFVWGHINICGLSNAKAVLVEE